jgi:CubicO group peptidase (beta-lactamase class C family)
MTAAERTLQHKILLEGIPSATEGVVVRVRSKGKIVCDVRAGKTYEIYDLASLTKLIFCNTALMLRNDSSLSSMRISDLLPWFGHRNIKVNQLLSHSAGLTWWKPFFKMVDLNSSTEQKWEVIKANLKSEKPARKRISVYSDLDYLTLAFCLTRLYQKPLHEIWSELVERLNLNEIGFNAGNIPSSPRSKYAPTEKCPWRKKILRGEVHDENTWALDGVSTHAGLFSSIDGIDQWTVQMRNAFLGKKSPIEQKTVEKFWTRAVPSKVGHWALGFMMPTKGSSSSGKYFSAASVGHTGFTGTSFWYDPKHDFSVVILSNRVYPTRKNIEFAKLRPKIHDWAVELFR